MFRRYLTVTLLCLSSIAGFSQNVSEQTKRLNELEKEIAFIETQLATNRSNQQKGLDDIALVQKKIANRKDIIAQLDSEIRATDRNIRSTEQKITALAREIERLKDGYAYLIYHAYKNRDRTTWILQVLASRSIEQGYRRWSYLKSYSEAMKNSAVQIMEQSEKLRAERAVLEEVRAHSVAVQAQHRAEQSKLEREESDFRQLIAQLSRRETEFRNQQGEKRREVEQLNREIERIIAAAARERRAPSYVESAADRALTGSFDSNKGRLPWPVRDGVITERFGQHNHPFLPNIKLPFNNGINITTTPHAEVFAIFDGVVKQLPVVPGYYQSILIQHGSYYTLYTKMERVTVRNGDSVKRGDVLGTLVEYEGASVIHFELWKGTEKQNPEQWISK